MHIYATIIYLVSFESNELSGWTGNNVSPGKVAQLALEVQACLGYQGVWLKRVTYA